MKKALTIIAIVSGAVCFASAACLFYLHASKAMQVVWTAVKTAADRLSEFVKQKIDEYNSDPKLPEFVDDFDESAE
jgi:hypothetical protein